MSIRKIAGLAAGFALAVGLIGNGVSAQWAKSVTAQENINVGSFGCAIVDWTGAPTNPDPRTAVTFTAPKIDSSAAGTAPFSFTVKNTGTVAQVLTVSSVITGLPAQFTDSLGTQSPIPLAGGDSHAYAAGLTWTDLSSYTDGASGNIKYTVNCGENAPAIIFDNHPSVLPSNLPSVGGEAYSFSEFGNGATFAGSARKLSTATVTMSSWACQAGDWTVPFGTAGACVTTPGATYSAPITFNVYNVGVGNSVGTRIATVTQTFTIPYRPSSIAGNDGKGWNADGSHGIATNITFTFAGETVPNTAIFGVAYNTDNHGYAPLHTSGNVSPLDALNIAMYPGTGPAATVPSVGAFLPDGLSAYLNDTQGLWYLDNGAGGTGTFRLDAGTPVNPTDNSPIGPYGGYEPAIQIVASY
jgi:hypothetical protein